ncbi:MAG: ATP-binding cassette domain-containing protein [Eisenbergiella massiliensis]
MLYQICNGAVRFAAETVLEHINFEIRNKEKIAVVGRNGCGKTTLLKLIAGEVELSKRDSDEDIYIARAGKPVIGYLKQNAFEDDSLTMEQEVREGFFRAACDEGGDGAPGGSYGKGERGGCCFPICQAGGTVCLPGWLQLRKGI